MPDTNYKIVLTVNITNSSIEPYNLTMIFKTSLGGKDINIVCNAILIPGKSFYYIYYLFIKY